MVRAFFTGLAARLPAPVVSLRILAWVPLLGILWALFLYAQQVRTEKIMLAFELHKQYRSELGTMAEGFALDDRISVLGVLHATCAGLADSGHLDPRAMR